MQLVQLKTKLRKRSVCVYTGVLLEVFVFGHCKMYGFTTRHFRVRKCQCTSLLTCSLHGQMCATAPCMPLCGCE